MTPSTPASPRKQARTPRTPTTATLTNEMAEKYFPRVQRQAARIARKLPRHVSVGDLVSAGCCGLIDAFFKYDPTRMESFDAYVDHRIRGAILDELRTHDPLTAVVHQLRNPHPQPPVHPKVTAESAAHTVVV